MIDEKDIRVRMRDGVHVALRVYRPDGPGAFPVLFAPAPYRYDNDDVPAMRQACQDAMVRWQTYIVTEASPTEAKVARTVRRTYQLLWKELSDQMDDGRGA